MATSTSPRHALYFLYFGSADAAEAGAADGRTAGYSREVPLPIPDYPDQCALECELFSGIEVRLGGDFDGWEAAARP